jgi:hypothetical protein
LKEKIIEQLKIFIKDIKKITFINEKNEVLIDGWKSSVSIFLSGIFGQESIEVNEIKNIKLDSQSIGVPAG